MSQVMKAAGGRFAWAALVLALLACASAYGVTREPSGVLLCVTNSGIEPLHVWTSGGGAAHLGRVEVHETRRLRLPHSAASLALLVGRRGMTWPTPDFVPTSAEAWQLDVGTNPKFDVLSLRPAEVGACRAAR